MNFIYRENILKAEDIILFQRKMNCNKDPKGVMGKVFEKYKLLYCSN